MAKQSIADTFEVLAVLNSPSLYVYEVGTPYLFQCQKRTHAVSSRSEHKLVLFNAICSKNEKRVFFETRFFHITYKYIYIYNHRMQRNVLHVMVDYVIPFFIVPATVRKLPMWNLS